jgi:hypothetical protein
MDHMYRYSLHWVRLPPFPLYRLDGKVLTLSLASVLFAISPADVYYWKLPFNAMWMAVLGADLYDILHHLLVNMTDK